MKNNILNKIISKLLFEQSDVWRDADPKTPGSTTYVGEDNVGVLFRLNTVIPLVRRSDVDVTSKRYATFAQTHGAATGFWSSFIVQTKLARKHSKTDVVDKQGLDNITDTDAAAMTINTAFDNPKNKDRAYFSPTGQLTTLGRELVFAVGPNVSKRKLFKKHYVWILDIGQILQISSELSNEFDDLRTYAQEFQSGTAGADAYSRKSRNIAVYYYTDLMTWFNALKKRIQEKQLKLNPIGSKLVIPELQYLQTDPDAAANTEAIPEQQIEITDANANQYNNTDFRGTALLRQNVYGQLEFVPQTGKCTVRDLETNQGGIFRGEFKDGVPYKGTTTYDDGTKANGTIKSKKIFRDELGRLSWQITWPPSARDYKDYKLENGDMWSGTFDENNEISNGILTTKTNADGYVYTIEIIDGKPTKGEIKQTDDTKKPKLRFTGKISETDNGNYKPEEGDVYDETDPKNIFKVGYYTGGELKKIDKTNALQYPYDYELLNKTVKVITIPESPNYVYMEDPEDQQWVYALKTSFEAEEQGTQKTKGATVEWNPVTNTATIEKLNNTKQK